MKNQTEEYKTPQKKQPFFSFVKNVMRLFYKRPRVTSLSGDIPDRAIFVSNHCNKRGPVVLTLYMPKAFCPWGAHEMLGGYMSRLRYLRDVYYVQKRGYRRFPATVCATFEAFFSIWFYRGMHFISSYSDTRLYETIKESMAAIDHDFPVLVFPENSSEGYKEILTEFFPGFVMLALHYYRKHGVDLPVYPVYYHDKTQNIMIGEPSYVQDYVKAGFDKKAIAEEFRKKVNALHDRILQCKTVPAVG